MNNIKHLVPLFLSFEGGYENDPRDYGVYNSKKQIVGSNKGISAKTYEEVFGYCPTISDMVNIIESQFELVLLHFATKIRYSQISNQSIADFILDFFWGSGYIAITEIQKLFSIRPDGIVGPVTIAHINIFEPQEELFNKIKQCRLDYVDTIINHDSKELVFVQGWKNRINQYTFTA